MCQAKAILNVLEQVGQGFLVARRLDGRWSVEVAGGAEHVGESITDALAQVTTVLAVEHGIEPHEAPPHELEGDTFQVEEPLEFCTTYVYGDGVPSLDADFRYYSTLSRAVGE